MSVYGKRKVENKVISIKTFGIYFVVEGVFQFIEKVSTDVKKKNKDKPSKQCV
jgi:surface polysaccharide O-acyltransferase-like enzyme